MVMHEELGVLRFLGYMAGAIRPWGFVRDHLSLGHLLLMPPHSLSGCTEWVGPRCKLKVSRHTDTLVSCEGTLKSVNKTELSVCLCMHMVHVMSSTISG